MTAPALKKVWNLPGDWGNRETAANMAALARSRQNDPLVKAAWVDILGAVVPPTTYDEGLMLRAWLGAHFHFVPDPVGPGVFGGTDDIELLRDPLLMLQRIRSSYVAIGDCDDAAILGLTLGLAAPVPFSGVHFVLVGLDADLPYTHVYAEILTARGWLDLDVTRGSQRIPRIAKREVIRV